DLANDRIGALLEYAAIVLDHRGIFPAQPLGRQLNGSERVLDLVRNAAGDVRPRRGTLRRHKLGDVIERDHVSSLGRAGLGRDAHGDIPLAPVTVDVYLPLSEPLQTRSSTGEYVGNLGHDLDERFAQDLRFRAT